jgi:GNAT superfamily N-acetyltransferase
LTAAADAAQVRPARASDEAFLRRLYAGLRSAEFAPLGLDPEAVDSLLAMQYAAQDRSYRQLHPAADFDLVLVAGEPAGRIYVERTATSIQVIDIALTPEYRGRGIGTRLLQRLLAEGAGSQRPVTLNAVRGSRALTLYRRLGFTVRDGDDVYLALERRPPAVS